MSDCKADDPTFPRACGTPSTYNNAGCRGDRCREAMKNLRRAQRSADKPVVPKNK